MLQASLAGLCRPMGRIASIVSPGARRSKTSPTRGSLARAAVFGGSKRTLSAQPAKLPDLAYDYGELEPVICAEIMQIHHTKHHQTYVNNLNAALEKLGEAEAKGDYAAMINLQGALNFNGGGHVNHEIFWTNLCPKSQYEPPSGELAQRIEEDFGGLENLQQQMTAKTVAVQGSGWGWLGYDTSKGKLVTAACMNQDLLSSKGPFVPLFGIDVWEHAYYLQYKNVRPDYVKAIWEICNWKNVEERFLAAKA